MYDTSRVDVLHLNLNVRDSIYSINAEIRQQLEGKRKEIERTRVGNAAKEKKQE